MMARPKISILYFIVGKNLLGKLKACFSFHKKKLDRYKVPIQLFSAVRYYDLGEILAAVEAKIFISVADQGFQLFAGKENSAFYRTEGKI